MSEHTKKLPSSRTTSNTPRQTGADDGPLSWRTDIDIPELGVVAGDIIVVRPEDPDRALTIVRRVSRETLTRYHERLCARASVVSRALPDASPPSVSPSCECMPVGPYLRLVKP